MNVDDSGAFNTRPRHVGPGSTFASRCPAVVEGHLGPMSLPRASIPQHPTASKNCGAIRCVAKTVKRCEPCYLAGSNMSFGRLIETATALLPPVSKTTITG